MNINLHTLVLETFDSNNISHLKLMKDLLKEKKIIHTLDRKNNSDPFNIPYIILLNNKMIGYMYLLQNKNDEVLLEYAILQNQNKKKYHEILLREVTDYLSNFEDIKRFNINVDLSNLKKLRTTLECGYDPDYEDYENKNYPGKMILRRKNPNYIQEGEENE